MTRFRTGTTRRGILVVAFLALGAGTLLQAAPTALEKGHSGSRRHVALGATAILGGEGRPRSLSRHARRARLVRTVELPDGNRLRLRATRRVSAAAVEWTAGKLAAGIEALARHLGPAPVDHEVYLVGVRRLPPAYTIVVKRKDGPPWKTVGVIAFTVPEPGRPSWGDLETQLHELVHHWLREGARFGGSGYPRWLEEGTADVLAAVVSRETGGPGKDRPLPGTAAWTNADESLLQWGDGPSVRGLGAGLPFGAERRLARRVKESAWANSVRYELSYHVVKETWDRDGGRTLVRLLEAFAGRKEVPSPEEQERIFREVVGEPFAAVVDRVRARAAAGNPPGE